MSKKFDKEGCNTIQGLQFKDPGYGEIPSIADCSGPAESSTRKTHYGDPIFQNDYCDYSKDNEKPKGVVCKV